MARVTASRSSLGQAVPLLMAVVAVAGAVGLGIARLGVEIHDRQQAQVVADAAALAALADRAVDRAVALPDTRAAADVATRNGGRLMSLEADGDDVVVVVMVHGHRATARATRAP